MEKINIKLPTIEEAEELLLWAHDNNPGPWLNHSKVVARAAEKIAENSNLDGKIAYISGLLHDIGRYKGVTGLRHIYDGFKLLTDNGYDYIGRICLTHSFPNKNDINFDTFFGRNDCKNEEIEIIQNEMDKHTYDDYDKLIQLCDSISMAEGICILEIRIVDVVRRYRICDEHLLNKWDSFFEIKKYFDGKCGKSIYKLFEDEIIKNCIG
jgi:putative nucleotidyltransferase with HDIG domain